MKQSIPDDGGVKTRVPFSRYGGLAQKYLHIGLARDLAMEDIERTALRTQLQPFRNHTTTSMQLGFVDTLVVFLSLGISLLIVVPLTGVLVRFRANYNPKALQLDAEGGAAPHTGPVVNSYFSMMARVWRIEVR